MVRGKAKVSRGSADRPKNISGEIVYQPDVRYGSLNELVICLITRHQVFQAELSSTELHRCPTASFHTITTMITSTDPDAVTLQFATATTLIICMTAICTICMTAMSMSIQ
jgi:hypothetical protein